MKRDYEYGLIAAALLFIATSNAMGAITSEGDVDLNGNDAIVGQNDDGALTITPPDAPNYNSIWVGQLPGSSGTVLVDGAGLTVQSSSIGDRGMGDFTVRNGGVFQSGSAVVGDESLGTLRVEGSGSSANFSEESFTNFEVGGREFGSNNTLGRGEIYVIEGAELETFNSTLGAFGSASVLVDGNSSSWRSNFNLRAGNADIVVSDGGHLIANPNNGNQSSIVLGAFTGSSNVLISGPGSSLTTIGSESGIILGESGQAVVRVEQGADVFTANTVLGGAEFFSGGEGLRRGVIELDGFGTTWTTNGFTFGTDDGRAELSIANGASLNLLNQNQNGVIIGEGPNSTARVTLDGVNSSWIATNDDLYVGYDGAGELHIAGGAYHTNGQVWIGLQQHAGEVVVSGSGSHWEVRDYLEIYQGKLYVMDGAKVSQMNSALIQEMGELHLAGGIIDSQHAQVQNYGFVHGDGVIRARFENESTGLLHVGTGEVLETTEFENRGIVEINEGELVTSEYLNNFNQLDLSSATLSPATPGGSTSGITNFGGAVIRITGGNNSFKLPVQNGGYIIATGDSTTMFHDEVSNSGILSVDNGSTVVFREDYNGVGAYGDGQVVFEGNLALTAGVEFEPGIEFTITADWQVNIQETSTPRLTSEGAVELGGELDVSLSGVTLAEGVQEIPLIEAAQVIDDFDFLPAADSYLGSRTYYRGIQYNATSVALLVEQLAAGDYNGDGSVDSGDYDAWVAAFGTTGDSLADGNHDGFVDLGDYTLWRDAMEGGPSGTVPEPGSIWMIATVLFASVCWRNESRA